MSDNVRYFQSSYDESRKLFLDSCEKILALDASFKHQIHKTSKDRLYTDTLYLPSKSPSDGLVIINSGTHGVEGLAGSAIQQMFLKEIFPHLGEDRTSFLVIHALNPYGFKKLRRVDQENVDLNRNFTNEIQSTSDSNKKYRELTTLINPQEELSLHLFSRINFYFKFLKMNFKVSPHELRKAILSGQYEFKKGLFYGGKNKRPSYELIQSILLNKSKKYQKLMLLDLHTGHGKRGHLHFLCPSKLNESQLNNQASVLKDFHIENDQEAINNKKSAFYQTNGDLPSFFSHFLKEKTTVAMTLEFGTLNSLSFLNSLESLWRCVIENQGFHWGHKDKATKTKVEKLFIELFYPSSTKWRNNVINNSREAFPLILKRFAKI